MTIKFKPYDIVVHPNDPFTERYSVIKCRKDLVYVMSCEEMKYSYQRQRLQMSAGILEFSPDDLELEPMSLKKTFLKRIKDAITSFFSSW